MLKNNIELDVKTKCIEAGKTQVELANSISTSAPYVNRVIRNKENIVNKTFLKMMDALGYDVELTYRKKK
ncbi:MAG: helix-turn-helix transcriptional regulator [Eubacterium sp.]|nr:helix-turn-helix transcriptional regulator [Eubacterium sp.]